MACGKGDSVDLSKGTQVSQLGEQTRRAAGIISHVMHRDHRVRHQLHVSLSLERNKCEECVQGDPKLELVDMVPFVRTREEPRGGYISLPDHPSPRHARVREVIGAERRPDLSPDVRVGG